MNPMVVGAEGQLSLPIGWTAPVLLEDGRVSVHGAGASWSEVGVLQELEAAGRITLVSPIPYEPSTGFVASDRTSPGSPGSFLLPAYVFYVSKSVRSLGLGVVGTVEGGIQLAVEGENAESVVAFLVDKDALARHLRLQWGIIYESVRSEAALFEASRKPEYLKKMQTGARVLYDLAYDRNTAIGGISMRCVVSLMGPHPYNLSQWMKAAVLPWKRELAGFDWNAAIEDTWLSISLTRQMRELQARQTSLRRMMKELDDSQREMRRTQLSRRGLYYQTTLQGAAVSLQEPLYSVTVQKEEMKIANGQTNVLFETP